MSHIKLSIGLHPFSLLIASLRKNIYRGWKAKTEVRLENAMVHRGASMCAIACRDAFRLVRDEDIPSIRCYS
jgi:hypothetical protein